MSTGASTSANTDSALERGIATFSTIAVLTYPRRVGVALTSKRLEFDVELFIGSTSCEKVYGALRFDNSEDVPFDQDVAGLYHIQATLAKAEPSVFRHVENAAKYKFMGDIQGITYLGPTVLAPEDGNDIYRPDGNTKVPYAINYRKPPSITVGGFVLNPDKKAHTFELDINIYLSALKKTSSVKLGTAPILCTFGTSAEWKKAKPMPSHFVVVIGNITDIIFKTKGSKSQKGTVDRFVITIKDIISTGSQSVPPATALPDSLDSSAKTPTGSNGGVRGGKRAVASSSSHVLPLLPVPSTLVKPDDKLCDVCKALHLTPSQFFVLPNNDEERRERNGIKINLGLVKDIKEKKYCPLCRMVLYSLGGINHDIPDIDRADGQPVEVTMRWDVPPKPSLLHHKFLVPVLVPRASNQTTGDLVMGQGDIFPEIKMLANDVPSPSKTSFLRLVGDQIDFKMVRNWLWLCQKWHGSACDKTEKFVSQIDDPATNIPHFRLIDTKDNCVVLAPKGSTYVALSYVWGKIDPLRLLKTNVEKLATPGSLLLPENNTGVPVTIRDAMEVVQKLHLRYLWVDSLCIVQDDNGPDGSKMGAISKMDLVYGGAYLTIMAATGIDANTGLPGLSPGTRRASQPVEEIYPGLRLGCMTTSRQTPVYFTRAWTFQEHILSSRRLVFKDGQISFQCQHNFREWREDVVFEGEKQGLQVGNTTKDDIGHFDSLISNYSKKSLSYDSDIYHAFAGMRAYFKDGLQVDLCHGIPDAYFDWFLLWTPHRLVPMRRAIAPSWSWSGWIGSMSSEVWRLYGRSIPATQKAIKEHTWIFWYQRKAHESEECTLVWNPQNASPHSSPTEFYGDRLQKRFQFDCSQTIPTPRTLVGAPKYLEDTYNPSPGSGFLQFWTVSVMFRIDTPTRDVRVRFLQEERLPRLVPFGIYGRDERDLGLVHLDPKWAENNVPKTHEFILLCEARVEDDNYEGLKYRMMLLEWHGDWAERVSLGWIEKEDLYQALGQGPVWKEIILG